MELLANHRVFQTNDLDSGRDFASRVWQKNDAQLRSSRYALTWNEVRLQRSSLSYVDHPCAVTARRRIDHTINGKPASSLNRQIVVHAPRQELKLDIAPFSLLMLNLDGEFVRSALDRRVGKAPEFETWAGEISGVSASATALRSFCVWAAKEADNPHSPLMTNGRVAANVERTMLSLFIECLAERRFRGRSPRAVSVPLRYARPRSGSMQICRTPSASRRLRPPSASVRERCRAHFAACAAIRHPTRFFDVALSARVRLWRQPGPTTRVTKIAPELGFYELRRFAVRYRQEFGEKAIGDLGARCRPRAGSLRDYPKTEKGG